MDPKKLSLIFCLSALLLSGICGVYTKIACAQSWEMAAHLPIAGKTDVVAVRPDSPQTLFIGSSGTLYGSRNEGKNWERLLGLGPSAQIHRIYFEQNRMFLLSSEGLFESSDFGKKWSRNFRGSGAKEQNVLHMIRDPQRADTFYLGTEGGFLLSRDNAKTWRKELPELRNQFITGLAADAENGEIFIAGEKGLYRWIPRSNRLDHVYLTRSPLVLDETDLENEPELSESENKDGIYTVLAASAPSSVIAIGTATGVWTSEDEGNHWQRLPLNGLKGAHVFDLVHSPESKRFFAAGENGVYVYDSTQKYWKELHEGLPVTRVNRLALVSSDPQVLYAATDEGVYRMTLGPDLIRPEMIQKINPDRLNLLAELIRREPFIGAVQKQTIRYANVGNGKIKKWHWGSRLRAFVPTFSVGKNYSRSDNVDIDRGGTSDPDRYIVGPRNSNQSWDMDLNWDLADLIWNTSETSIDSREKLMVELRDDLLSEVTRLYFERRRAQAEFVLGKPLDPMERAGALLRLDELTAGIDALTDGFLTRELKQLYARRPEFRILWEE